MRQRRMFVGAIFLSIMLSVMLIVPPPARPSTSDHTWSLGASSDENESENRTKVCGHNTTPQKCQKNPASGGVTGTPVTYTFDVPGAVLTWATGINNADTIVGYYQDSTTAAAYHGFIHQGTNFTTGFTTVDVPGSILTYVQGINDLGDIVGIYEDSTGATHGFVHHGTNYATGYLTFTVPGSDCCVSPNGVANDGTIVGTYGGKGHIHGFTHTGADLTTGFSSMDATRATDTVINAIDRTDAIVGYYFDTTGMLHGFSVRAGAFSTVDTPSTLVPTPLTGTTQLWGTNSGGVNVGYYLDLTFNYDAFKAQAAAFTLISLGTGNVVFAVGINENSDVVGEVYNSTAAKYHGFAIINPTASASTGSTGSGKRHESDDNNDQGENGDH